jgi:hypothetical protein
MTESPQRKAVKKYRKRLAERGLSRFEVVAPAEDRELIRSLAGRLAEGGPDAEKARKTVGKALSPGKPSKGGLWSMLRRSPMVGADLDVSRPFESGREIDL